MVASVLPTAQPQYLDNSGQPLAGGKVYTYAAGTTTQKATYADSAATVANANPVVLDASGRASIYWQGAYRVEVRDATGALIYSVDNFTDQATAAGIAAADSAAVASAQAVAEIVQPLVDQVNDDAAQTALDVIAADAAVSTAAAQAGIATTQAGIALAATAFTTNRPDVRLAATAPLPANTYNNGAGTISITATGVLTVDGSAVALNDDIVVPSESDQTHNGIYRCTTAGAVGVSAVLTRRTTEDTGAELAGACVKVLEGTAKAGSSYRVEQGSITLGTTAVTFAQLPGPTAVALAAEAAVRQAADDKLLSAADITVWTDALAPNGFVRVVLDDSGDLRVLESVIAGYEPGYWIPAPTAGASLVEIQDSIQEDVTMVLALDADGEVYVLMGTGGLDVAPSGSDASLPVPQQFVVLLSVGQSNLDGRGKSAESPAVPSGVAKVYYSGALTDLEDPVGTASTGSLWPALALSIWRGTRGRWGLIVVPATVGGTAQLAAADGGQGNWSSTGTLRGQAITRLTDALAALDSAGVAYTFGGILHCLGETDASRIDDGTPGVTIAAVKSEFGVMLNYFQTQTGLGTKLPYGIIQTGQRLSGDTSGWQQMRAAQVEYCRTYPNVFMASTLGRTYAARGLMGDDLHWNQTALNEIGDTLGAPVISHCLGTI